MAGKIGALPVAEKGIASLSFPCCMPVPVCPCHSLHLHIIKPQQGICPARYRQSKRQRLVKGLLFFAAVLILFSSNEFWGRTGFDGDVEAEVAGRGAAGLVKSGNKSNCQRKRLRLRLRCLVSVWYRLFFNGQVVTGDAQ